MLSAPVNYLPVHIFNAVIDIEAGTKNGVILWQYFRNQFRLIGPTASLPAHLDFLQAYYFRTFDRPADPFEINVAIQATTKLNIVTDDFHPFAPLLARPWG
jgi:hypothetical protein